MALYFAAPWQLPDARPSGRPALDLHRPAGLRRVLDLHAGVFLLSFLILFALLTRLTGMPDRDDATDFYVLIAGATLGMCLMVSANHMLIVFLGIEMASVPSYALAGMLRDRRPSSEAALKYAIYGAGAAGIMLYGISLLVGVLGSAYLPTCAAQLAALLQLRTGPADRTMVLVLGSLMVMVGVAFKLSAVPFHFWAPDVFEGAPAEVAAFLSIASKAAALGLLVRLAMGLVRDGQPGRDGGPGTRDGSSPPALVALLAVVTVHIRQPGRVRPNQHQAAVWPIPPSPTPAT